MEIASALALMLAVSGCDQAYRASPMSDLDAELSKFPPSESLDGWDQLARNHRDWIWDQMIWGDETLERGLRFAYKQQDLVCEVYWWLRMARNTEWMSLEERKRYAGLIKKAIGDEDYANGRLPEPIP